MKPNKKKKVDDLQNAPPKRRKGFLRSILTPKLGRNSAKTEEKRLNSLKNAEDMFLVGEYLETGCQRSLAELYSRYSPKVLGTCFTLLRDKEEAKDAMMEVFEKILVNIEKARPQHFATWVYSITRNHCLSYLRKEGRYCIVDFNDPNYRIPDYSEQGTMPEIFAQLPETVVAEAMKMLPERQAVAVHLFYFVEKSYQEIAQIMHCEIKEVKSHLQNGRRNLAIRLEGWYSQQKEA